MHYCLPKVRVRQQWSWRWVWITGTMTAMYSLHGHWIVCGTRPHYKTGRGRITRRAEDCMHSSTFSHWQSNLHATQPTYSLLCSPSRPQAVCNRRIEQVHVVAKFYEKRKRNGNGMEMEEMRGKRKWLTICIVKLWTLERQCSSFSNHPQALCRNHHRVKEENGHSNAS